MSVLSSTQLSEATRSFETFDKDRDGKCTRRELGFLLRGAGKTPSESELEDLYKKYELDDDASELDQATFIKILELDCPELPAKEKQASDLRDQFGVFDRNADGTISLADFRYVMTNLGDRMSDDEVDCLLAEDNSLVEQATGLIHYEKLIKIILAD